jgi:hypothetical protein
MVEKEPARLISVDVDVLALAYHLSGVLTLSQQPPSASYLPCVAGRNFDIS